MAAALKVEGHTQVEAMGTALKVEGVIGDMYLEQIRCSRHT